MNHILRKYLIAILLLFLALPAMSTIETAVLNDTIDPEDEAAFRQKVEHQPQRTVEKASVLDHVMESRFHFQREDFRNKWYDHTYLEFGSGLERIVPAGSYSISSMTDVHLSLGKMFTPMHGLRVSGQWTSGQRRSTNLTYTKISVKGDFLYNLSSAMYGYDPMRRLEVSALLGGGYSFASTKNEAGVSSPEVHTGLQFKIFTGAYSYIGIEPYVGLVHDRIDFSGIKNWRGYDVFYGVNFSLAHFFSNNFSDSQRQLYSASAPWFFDLANGLNFGNGIRVSSRDNIGNSVSCAVGKWFSPAFGLRLSAQSANTTWAGKIETTPDTEREIQRNYNATVYLANADLLINPLGFTNHYDWDSPFGFNLVGGIGFGTVRRFGNLETLHDEDYITMKFGLNAWARISPNIRFFVEPYYSRGVKEKTRKVQLEDELYTDNAMNINIGISMLLRKADKDKEAEQLVCCADTSRRMSLGMVLGLPIVQTQSSYIAEPHNTSYNALAYLDYRLNRLSNLRLMVDYQSLTRNMLSDYYDISVLGDDVSGKKKTGVWSHRTHLLFTSVTYGIDMSQLLSHGKTNCRFQTELFVGPTLAANLGETANICPSSIANASADRIYLLKDEAESCMKIGGVFGMKLAYNASSRFAIVCLPRFYFVNGMNLEGHDILRFGDIQPYFNFGLGLQYRL